MKEIDTRMNIAIILLIQTLIAVCCYFVFPDYVFLILGVSILLKVVIIIIGNKILKKYE